MVDGEWWMVNGGWEAPSVRGWWMVDSGWFREKQRASRKGRKVRKGKKNKSKTGTGNVSGACPPLYPTFGHRPKKCSVEVFCSEQKGRSREQPISLSFLFHLKFNIYHLTFRPQAGEVFSVPTGGRPLCGSARESASASKERGKTEND